LIAKIILFQLDLYDCSVAFIWGRDYEHSIHSRFDGRSKRGPSAQSTRKGRHKKHFIEKVSAKDTKRPKLIEMLEFARESDVIYIKDFSRLARSTQDLVTKEIKFVLWRITSFEDIVYINRNWQGFIEK